MRILQLSSAQAFGGGERHLVDLANGLAARGHEVHTILRPASPVIKELDSELREKVVTLPLRNSIDVMSAQKLARFVRDEHIEIVHAHMARDYPLAAYAARQNRRARLILTRHVLFQLNRVHSLTFSYAARVIAVSAAVKRALVAQRLLPDDRIVIIPNGIDASRFDKTTVANRYEFRRKWNIDENVFLAGSVGELNQLKGHAEFVYAATLIRQSFPNTKFLVAGLDTSPGGQNLTFLKRLIAERNLESSVLVLGWVEDLASLYRALDVFVSASHTESFGLAIAEAMATGTPVIATRTEGATEIIDGEENGVLVPLGNVKALAEAVMDLIREPEKRVRLGSHGCARIRTYFSVEQMVNATEKLYREVLN